MLMEESDENDNSFEVLCEETPPLDLSMEVRPDEFDTGNSGQLWGSCLHVQNSGLTDSQLTSTPEFPVPNVANSADELSESPSVDRTIVEHDATEQLSKHSHPRRRQKVIRNLFPTGLPKVQPVKSHPAPIVSHQKCALALTGLLGVCLALLFAAIRSSYRASHLEDEIANIRLTHAKELLHLSENQFNHVARVQRLISDLERERDLLREMRMQSEQRLNREMQSEKMVVELQKERDKLVDEIRSQSERLAAHVAESNKVILELQAERHQLMTAAEKAKNEEPSDFDSSQSDDSFFKKLKKMKLFKAFRKQSFSWPGLQRLNKYFCKIPRLCGEL